MAPLICIYLFQEPRTHRTHASHCNLGWCTCRNYWQNTNEFSLKLLCVWSAPYLISWFYISTLHRNDFGALQKSLCGPYFVHTILFTILTRNARAYTSARSIGFCVIWVCISSSSSFQGAKQGAGLTVASFRFHWYWGRY